MNQRTAQWLRDIKITPAHINQFQLKNGYLFGLVFERLNLVKDKKFKNSQDLACVFQNFKNAKDLLYEHFGIAFPANEIIYRSSELMEKVREACEEYEQNKKQLKLTEIKKKYLNTTNNNATVGQQKLLTLRQNEIKQQQSFSNNTMTSANRTFSSQEPKMPAKILQIQKKLTKYRDQQTRHQLLTLQTRKQQLDSMNQAIQDHRYFEMSKLKMNHEMRKEFEKKVADVVTKTNEVKLSRIEKETQFFRFMKSKKDNFLSSLRQQQQQAFVQGLDDFQLNCLRQGIQLEHDPSKPYQSKEENFNSKVMLQRIKDNIKKLQKQRKQRQKRTNSKYVETQQANVKSQKVWEQNYMIERMQKSMASHQKYIKETEKQIRFQETQKEQISLKLSKKTVKPLPQATQQQRDNFESQLRANRLVFYDKQIQRLERKDKALKAIAQETLQALLYTMIVAEEQETNMNFTYSEWKGLEKTFVQYEVPIDDKRKKEHSELEAKEPKEHQAFYGYLKEIKQYQTQQTQRKGGNTSEQKEIAQLIDQLIEQAYPKKQQTQPQNLPLYMPLRIGLSGNKLSGKTTQIKKLLAKYPSLVLIDPKKILTQAIELARPPPQNEDPKKKKQSKKPQEQTPERLELKKFGQQILAQLKAQSQQQTTQPTFDYQTSDFKHIISAIKWKLQQSFKNLSHEQILNKYNQSLEQQNQRLKDFEKNQEEKNKKKDSKKPATQVVVESPVFNEFFYTQGFVLDNVELSGQNLRVIERELNGFVRTEERLNEEAQNLREELGQILPIYKSQIPTNLNTGFFNALINLDVSPQTQQQRNQGRKLDPTTGEIYHPKFNPHPTDVKGLGQRLVEVKKVQLQSGELSVEAKRERQNFYQVFGYEDRKMLAYRDLSEVPGEEVNGAIVKTVEETLKVEYGVIKGYEREELKVVVENENSQQVVEQKQAKQLVENQQQQQSQPQSTNPLSTLPQSSSSFLLSKQLSLKQSFSQSISQHLSQLPSIRHSFQQSLIQHQRQFLQIITRPDDKANRILTFQDNYNKLLQEKSNVINDKTAIGHLVGKLDELYDSLWVSIEGKKNEAIEKRKGLIASVWINSEVEKVVEIGKNILQAELDYLVDMLAFIIVLQLHTEGKTHDPIIDHLCLGIPKQSQPIESVITAHLKVSPRLQFYINQTNSCLDSLPQWYVKKQSQSKTQLSTGLQRLAESYINKQRERMEITVEYLKELVFSYSEEQMCYFRALVNKMDDWIISGIKDENDFTYAIYKDLKASIQKITRSQLKDLFPTPVTASIKPIERLTHFHQPIPFENHHLQLIDYSSFKIFLEELKCYCFSVNSTQSSAQVLKINFLRFRDYFLKRKKSKLLSDIYLRLDFDTMQQYLVTDNEASFRQVALAMILWDFNVLDEETLNKYELQLSGQNLQRALLSSPEQLSVTPFTKAIQNPSRQEISSLQHLIYDIMQNEYTHQISVKQYIEILGSFSSLQLFKYGDSLMMLNEQTTK